MNGANALTPGCPLGSVLDERTQEITRRIDKHEMDQTNTIAGLWKRVDRLPHWAVVTGWLMAGTIGWLAHYIH